MAAYIYVECERKVGILGVGKKIEKRQNNFPYGKFFDPENYTQIVQRHLKLVHFH